MSTHAAEIDPEAILAFPKVELHLHVEACLTEERVETLADSLGVPMLRPRGQLYEYSSLAEFLTTYEWWCDLLRTPEFAEQLAYDTAAYCTSQGIIYAELLTGPRYWAHLRYEELLDALAHGLERAHADGYADCRLVPSISREQSAGWAMELVDWIGRRGHSRIVGIGLDGNEAIIGRVTRKFEHVYARAADLGLGRTVHSGESSGPEGVWDVLNFLHVDRIDHGVRAIEDDALVRRLAEAGITLNVCPTSNVITGLYPTLADHPVGRLMEAGVPVTVNSDDPMAMRLTLTSEFVAVGRTFHWSIADLAQVTQTAVDAAFCDDDRRAVLREKVNAYLAQAAD